MILNYLPTFAQATVGSIFASQKRVLVLIDGSNLYHSLKKSFGSARIDLNKFCLFVAQGRKITKINYYISPVNRLDAPEKYKSQQMFLEKIGKIEKLSVFLGRLERRPDGGLVEKGVDVKLATDLLSGAFRDEFDEAILVSNDADFVSAIQQAQSLGKRVINVSFSKTKSYHLNKVCN